MINDISEMMNKMSELIETSEPEKFTDGNKAIISTIAEFARTTKFYKDTVSERINFWKNFEKTVKDASTPAVVMALIVTKIAKAPSFIDAVCYVISYMPHLDELLKEIATGEAVVEA